MPKEYEAIRDSIAASGKSYDEAQSIAAGTYNKRHPGNPVTGKMDKREAKYHSPALSGEGQCKDCSNFNPPDRCRKVTGSIEPGGSCKYFARNRQK